MSIYPKIGLLRSTSKLFEKRIPIHPEHFKFINPILKKHLFVEKKYLQDFGYSDYFCKEQGIQVEDRHSLISSADCCLLVRPMSKDLLQMKERSVALGWMHCVQSQDMAEAAILNELTLICMESLFDDEGNYFFAENSRITGQQAIRYALNITDRISNIFEKVVVIGHGSAGVSAIHELLRLGFKDITCFSKRSKSEIKNVINGVQYIQIQYGGASKQVRTIEGEPILNLLKNFQIIVNATAQNIYQPAIFLRTSEIEELKKGTLVIDISCDRNMGFEFSEITFLNIPIIQYGFISYCAIDHLPTLDFNNASQAISKALIKIMPELFQYLVKDNFSRVLEKAIQIRQGQILNPDISYYREHFFHSTCAYNLKQIKQPAAEN